MPDAWSHPSALALRDAADAALAQAQAAVEARRAALLHPERSPASAVSLTRQDRQKWAKNAGPGTGWGRGRRELKGTPSKSPPQRKSPRPGGHPRRAGTPDEPSSLDLGKGSAATTRWPPMGQHQRAVKVTPRARSSGGMASETLAALKSMNLRALRQKARAFGIGEALLEAAVEGENPKKALIALIEAEGGVEAPPAPANEEDDGVETSKASPDKTKAAAEPPCAATGLASLPTALMEALYAVEAVSIAVETGDQARDEGEGEDEDEDKDKESEQVGVPIATQLGRLKQTYIADLTAALKNVELAIAADEEAAASSTKGKQSGKGGYFDDADESEETAIDSAGTITPAAQATHARTLSLLESMAADLLQGRVISTLPVAALTRLGGASKCLLATVRGAELQATWEKHWSARWGDSGGRGSGHSGGGVAEAFSYRANLELAWRTTRWSSSSDSASAGGGSSSGSGGNGGASVSGRTMLQSTVNNASTLLSVDKHTVCTVAFDPTTNHAVTGDTEGLVRLWDVSRCLDPGRGPQSRDARLGVLRMHNKGHAVRWAQLHGRRLLVSCAATDTSSIATGETSQQAGRLVLADLDETRLNASQRCLGVASCSLDARCGFIGTGHGSGSSNGSDGTPAGTQGNGVPEKFGWVGVDHQLIGFDLTLDYDSVLQRPLPQLASIRMGEPGDYLDAVIPLCSGGSAGDDFAPAVMGAAVATSDGIVHTVDLQMALSQAGDDEALLQHWDAPAYSQRVGGSGSSAVATVPAASAIVAAWWCPNEEADSVTTASRPCGDGCLSVIDPRQSERAAYLDAGKCPAIVSLFAPPDLSVPTVLAATATGVVYLVDLRMLRAEADWLVAIDAACCAGAPQLLTGSAMLVGGAKTILAARHDGALLSAFGRRGWQHRRLFGSGGLRSVATASRNDGAGEDHEDGGEVDAWEDSFTKKKVQTKKEKKKKKVGEKAKAQGRRQTTGKQGGRSKGSR